MIDVKSTSVVEVLKSIYVNYKRAPVAQIVSEKPSDGYVTGLDLWLDEHLATSLKKICDIDYISEESIHDTATSNSSPNDFWLADPLDGTLNAIIGIPYFSTAVSLVIDNRIMHSVVLNLANGDIYHAERGGGFMKNGARVRRTSLTDKTIFSTGLPHDRRLHEHQLNVMSRLLPHIDDFRRLASPCLDLCLIAEGVLDGCVEFLKGWDLAAGTLFLEEVGMTHNHCGVFHLSDLHDQFYFAAADESLMPIVLEALRTNR